MLLKSRKIRREACDVLVVGAGGAGLRAAITADEKIGAGGKVMLATRGKVGYSGVTAVACSDRMAFHATLPHTEPGTDEAWFYHAEDIYEIGGQVSDAHLARILATESARAYQFLEDIGVPFARKEGRPHQFVTDGSEYARACYTGPTTAVDIERKLVDYLQRTGVETIENCSVFRLLVSDKQVRGALALVEEEPGQEEFLIIEAGAVIMATGGGGEIYAENVFPPGNSGDAFTAAFLAGAELVNMEFIQIGIASLATKLNCSGSMMRAIPRFVNDAGEEFVFKYFPPETPAMEVYNTMFRKGATWPLTYEKETHKFDIAVYKERCAGRKVYLDYTTNPTGFDFNKLDPDLQRRYREEMKTDLGAEKREQSPAWRLQEINTESIKWLQERGIDPVGGDWVEIGSCSQHFQGGVKINSRGETTVKGLYAAGECAGGQHGANRPGGNALLDGQVFGRICGEQAALLAGKENRQEPQERQERQERHAHNGRHEHSEHNEQKEHDKELDTIAAEILGRELTSLEECGGLPAAEAREKLQQLMSRSASVVRTAAGIKAGLAELQDLQRQGIAKDENGVGFALETRHMFPLAEIVLRAMEKRDESRGPHLRFQDYADNQALPRQDPDWQKYLVLYRSADEPGDGAAAIQMEIRPPVRDYYYRENEK